MTVHFNDPTILGSMIGAVSGFVGAMVGATISYRAAKTQYSTEYHYRKWDAIRAVTIEICNNHAVLFLALDRLLPAHLARINRKGRAQQAGELVTQSSLCSVAVFDALFSELVCTAFGSELITYYSRIREINRRVALGDDFDRHFGDHVRQVANCLAMTCDLVPAMIDAAKHSPTKGWGKNQEILEVSANMEASRFIADLAKCDLKAIEDMLEGDKVATSISPRLVASDPEQFRAYLAAARAL